MAVTMPQQPAAANPPRQVVDPGKMRRKGWILSIAATLLAMLAGIGASAYLNQLEAEVGVKQMVVVAAKPIPARALITPDMLTMKEIPVKYLAPSYILNSADLVDGNTTALINVAPGEYIQQNMVSRNAGLEAGHRAVAVAVNSVTSVGNSVRQGNYVDIVVSYLTRDGKFTTEVLLQKVKVLAVDTLLPAQGGTGGQTYLPAGVEGEVKLAPTTVVTLDLTPEEALKVTHAANYADELRLIIRRLDEDSTPNVEAVQFVGNPAENNSTANGLNPGAIPSPIQPNVNPAEAPSVRGGSHADKP